MRKILLTIIMVMTTFFVAQAQGVKPLPSIHVEGKWLTDMHGNHVVLHGVMDTPSAYFNSGRWGWSYDEAGRQRCLDYFEKLFTALEQAKCTVFRLHLEPAWTNDNSKTYIPLDQQSKDDQGNAPTGEADITHFNPERLKTYLRTLYFPLMKKAMDHGMYVVVRPPGVCPHNLKVGDYYQNYLKEVWSIFTQNDSIMKYPGQISIELANEPVNVRNANGQSSTRALYDFFQPVVDVIRANGFKGIIWVPGTGWQSQYADYSRYPIKDSNFGYAVHDYNGWYGCDDKNITTSNLTQAKNNKINQFRNQVPVVETSPIIITEVDWSPAKPGSGHYNEHNEWVESNYGTWATGTTSKWGACFKAVLDHYGNISMTLSGTDCLLDVTQLLADGSVTPAFGGLDEACGKACMDWYADYYTRDWPHSENELSSDRSRTVTGLEQEGGLASVMVGRETDLQVMAIYQTGRRADVTKQATYTVDKEGYVTIDSEGHLKALRGGTTRVTASFTDEFNNTVSTTFMVDIPFFVLDADHVDTAIGGQAGIYNPSLQKMRPAGTSLIGWRYGLPIDISDYKYLVLKLGDTPTCSAAINIYTDDDLSGNGFSVPIGKNNTTVMVDLSTARYTTGPKTGEPVDLKNVRIIGFSGDGLGKGSIQISEFYLSNSEGNPNFYVYLCFGQSNMEGNAAAEPVDMVGNERFQMLATCAFDNPRRSLGKWYIATPPIVNPVGGLGLSDYFGRTMADALPHAKIGVVAVAMGGSPIEMFDKDKYSQKMEAEPTAWWAQIAKDHYGSNPYKRLIDMAKEAQKVGVIKGILLHQGCSNNGDPNWPGMVKKIYEDMLTDLGLEAEDVPLFVGETERQDMGGGCYGHNVQVARMPQVVPTSHVISSENIPGNGKDAWHFSAEGYRRFGKRYAIEALKLMGIEIEDDTNPVNDEPVDDSLVPGTPYTGSDNLAGKTFAIVNTATQMAFHGSSDQHLAFSDYKTAFSDDNSGYLFKAEAVTVSGSKYYRLRLITPAGGEYSVFGKPGYLNSQPTTGWCSFILGLNNQNGEDLTNGALWNIQYVDGKGFTLKNVGTGKYLQDAAPAKYDSPAYFSLCKLTTVTAVDPVVVDIPQSADDDIVYSLHGVKVGHRSQWNRLPRGMYILNRKKIFKP